MGWLMEIESQSRYRIVARFFVFFLALSGFYVAFAPLDFLMPRYGLDGSWEVVLGEATARGLKFGEDIIFTGGPLSSVYTRYFRADFFSAQLLIGALCIGTSALLITILALQNSNLSAGFTAAGCMFAVLASNDAIFIAFPMLTALAALRAERSVMEQAGLAAGILCSAISTLAKFSVFPMAVVAFLLVDLIRLGRRRWPFYLGSYLLITFMLFAWLEGPTRFLPFISGSLSVSAGYTEAMFVAGPGRELVAFFLAILVLLVATALSEFRAVVKGSLTWSVAVARWLIVATYLFVTFKAGFVRHDAHSIIAWSGLGVAALTYFIIAPYTVAARGVFLRSSVRLIFPLIAVLALLVAVPFFWSFHTRESPSVLVGVLATRVQQARTFFANPTRTIEVWKHEKDAAWARVRDAKALPMLDGTVDVIPSLQSSVLAHGLNYVPRFTIQEYTTYNRRLIEANRRSLIERGPRYLLFQPGSIDGRHPAMAEGPIWPDIIRYYEPYSLDGDLLTLRRRLKPIEELLGHASIETVAFGQDIALPDTEEPQFLRAKIEKTWLAKFVEVVFKPPVVSVRLTYADGKQQRYRIVPAIAEAGFIISPLVARSSDFLLLASGNSSLLARVSSMSFETNWLGRFLFGSSFELTHQPLSLTVLRQQQSGQ
jgi:hypothetical protein